MDIALYTLRAVAYAIIQPPLAIVLIGLAIIFYRQNKKTTVMQTMIIGESIDSPLELTLSQVVVGVFAGVIGSLMLSYVGVIFDKNSNVYIIFIISLILMMVKPRFICFSYSGALLGLISICLTAFSSVSPELKDIINVDIVALITLIGVLHFIEGLLVMTDGKRGTIPIFTNKDGKIVGGFAFKRYWALPIAVMIITGVSTSAFGAQTQTPNWWPILKSNTAPDILKNAVISLTAVYGVIGYNAVTFTKSKAQKTIHSGLAIAIYGIILSIVAQLARFGVVGQVSAILFMPIAHDLMLKLQRSYEIKGTPKYVSDENGIMVLEVAPNSPAYQMGIKSGDLLVEVNEKKIEKEEDILNAVKNETKYIVFKVKKAKGYLEDVTYRYISDKKYLGVVFVPRGIPKDSVIVKYENNKFQNVLEKMKEKHKDDDL